MGTWGPGIFADDTAADARDDWLDLARGGTSPADANAKVLSNFAGDTDATDIATLALASVAWRYGRLDADLRVQALAVLSSGRDAERWREADRRTASRRKVALDELAQRLRTSQPAAAELRPKRLRRPEFVAGTLITVELDAGLVALCRVYHTITSDGPYCEYEPARWSEARPPRADEVAALEPIAVEPGVPIGYEDMWQPIGPHRCGVHLKRGERADPRIRIVVEGTGGEQFVVGPADHIMFGVAGWISHLSELYRTGTWNGVRRLLDVPHQPPRR